METFEDSYLTGGFRANGCFHLKQLVTVDDSDETKTYRSVDLRVSQTVSALQKLLRRGSQVIKNANSAEETAAMLFKGLMLSVMVAFQNAERQDDGTVTKAYSHILNRLAVAMLEEGILACLGEPESTRAIDILCELRVLGKPPFDRCQGGLEPWCNLVTEITQLTFKIPRARFASWLRAAAKAQLPLRNGEGTVAPNKCEMLRNFTPDRLQTLPRSIKSNSFQKLLQNEWVIETTKKLGKSGFDHSELPFHLWTFDKIWHIQPWKLDNPMSRLSGTFPALLPSAEQLASIGVFDHHTAAKKEMAEHTTWLHAGCRVWNMLNGAINVQGQIVTMQELEQNYIEGRAKQWNVDIEVGPKRSVESVQGVGEAQVPIKHAKLKVSETESRPSNMSKSVVPVLAQRPVGRKELVVLSTDAGGCCDGGGYKAFRSEDAFRKARNFWTQLNKYTNIMPPGFKFRGSPHSTLEFPPIARDLRAPSSDLTIVKLRNGLSVRIMPRSRLQLAKLSDYSKENSLSDMSLKEVIWYLIVATTFNVGDRNATNLLVDTTSRKVWAVDAADQASCFLSSSLMECLFTRGKMPHKKLRQQLVDVIGKHKGELEQRISHFQMAVESDNEYDSQAKERLETILRLLKEE